MASCPCLSDLYVCIHADVPERASCPVPQFDSLQPAARQAQDFPAQAVPQTSYNVKWGGVSSYNFRNFVVNRFQTIAVAGLAALSGFLQ